MRFASRRSFIGFLLLIIFALLLGAASPSLGAEKFCSDPPYFGVIDGSRHPAPTQISIDTDCTFKNFPESKPLTTTVNFHTNDPTIYLIIFDNVFFTGHMACANVDHRIWFSNSSDYGSSNACQDLFIPVETIDKKNPVGQTTAAVGVPFTYTLTVPSMNLGGGPSPNDLHSVTIWDNLTETGADLTYVDIQANYKSSGDPVTLEPETDPSAPGGVWTPKNLSYKKIPLIEAGEQIVIAVTVVLDDTPGNASGTQFTNTAKWQFGRLIDNVYYEPLPGEWGQTEPMTIVEPDLVVTKTGPASVINLGQWAEFNIDVSNNGTWSGDAWNVNILDRQPSESSNRFNGGMCDLTPEVTGVTLAGRSLTLNTDYLFSYTGCELSFSLLEAAGPIGPSEHLDIAYRTKVDADSESGAVLTNVAAANSWSNNADTSIGQSHTCTPTDGTEGVADCQDAHSLLVALSGYFFEKSVSNPDTGETISTAMPGETLRYTLHLRSIDDSFTGLRFYDDLNASAAFVPDSLSFVNVPGDAVISNPGAGILDVGNLHVAPGGEIDVIFDITLLSTLPENYIVLNQSELIDGTDKIADSDDPNINGQADPDVEGDEDPTQVVIAYPPALPPLKETLQTTATIGEEVRYRITVPSAISSRPLYDVVITDTLDGNLEYLGFTQTIGPAVTDNSTPPNLSFSVDQIAAGQQVVIEVQGRVRNILSAQQGVTISNSVSYTYANTPGGVTQPALASEIVTLALIEPHITTITKSPSTPAPTAGETLRYSVTLTASSGVYVSDVFDAAITDSLGLGLIYAGNPTVTAGTGPGADNTIGDPAVTGDGSTVSQTLDWSLDNGTDIDIAEGTSVTIAYDVRVLDSVLANQALTNSVVARWTGIDGLSAFERDGSDGIGGLNDYITQPATATVTTPDINSTITKNRISDTYGAGDADVRIGDIVEYELRLSVPEGTLGNLEIADALPQGLKFEGTVSINGSTGPAPYAAVAPFTHAPIDEASVTGDPVLGPTTVTWSPGSVTNAPDDGLSDDFVIIYRARVLNEVLSHDALNIPLSNTVNMSYDTADGPVTQSDIETVAALQPMLTVIKRSNPASGSTVAAGTTVTYTVDIRNTGTAPAYDVVLQDVIPSGMRTGGVTMVSTYLLSSGSSPGLANLAPDYDSGGVATWDFDSGVYMIPAGDTLRVVYDVIVDSSVGPGLALTNTAQVTTYYSFDDEDTPMLDSITGVPEIYGPTASASTTLYTGASPAKVLISPTIPEATIGQEVVYEIRVPSTAIANDLYDVVITDTLDGNLEYLGFTQISGPAVTDNSTSPNLSFSVGQIAAGQQVVIEVQGRVRNILSAQQGVTISNSVSSTYANTPGGPTQPALASEIVTLALIEPHITTITKSPSTSMPTPGEALRYSVTLTASGGTDASDVFDAAITDSLGLGLVYAGNPTVTAGTGPGADNTIGDPTIAGDGSTVSQTLDWSLDNGTDIDIAEGTSVTIAYDVRVLESVINDQELTNSVVARWTGIDGLSAFERDGSDGIGGLNDYITQPFSTVTTARAAILQSQKTVTRLIPDASGAITELPGMTAAPGDRLRYTIEIVNTTDIPMSHFSLVDEFDRLNIDRYGTEMFQPDSIENVNVPPGADFDIGNGVLTVNNLGIDASGTLTVSFEILLAPVIDNGTIVLNQGQLMQGDTVFGQTDDPNVDGEENPTETLITSAPVFEVQKTSTIMEGDPSVLMAGETLRYTITVRNIGNENAVNVRLRDFTPAHTTYVPSSTTLNGIAVPDPSPGVNPLHAGILINAPENTVSGYMNADTTPGIGNTATVVFDVVVDPNAMDGLIIENQGFISSSGAGGSPQPEQPSDDPSTSVPDDPTRNIVGNLPLLYAQKTVQIHEDSGSEGIVDPEDILQYTVVISNFGAIPASDVRLTDAMPAYTTYVADSIRLNGAALAPDGGVSPLIAGLTVNSSDNPGDGIISAGESATITFEVAVNIAVPPGTLITNQGSLTSLELPPDLTDADGVPSNGRQPTVIVVGEAQLLSITKEVLVVNGGFAEAGGQLEYIIRVANIGSLPATRMTISDYLMGGILADQVTYVADSGRLNGSSAGVTFFDGILTADYDTQYGDLQAGENAVLRFRVEINPVLAAGTTITNIGRVRWNDPVQTETARVSIDVGGTPGSAGLNGNVWHDADFDRSTDTGSEAPMRGWLIDLYNNGQLVATVLTDDSGAYHFNDLLPTESTPGLYELRFRAPGAGPNTASMGNGDSPFTNGPQRISDISVSPGASLQNLNLPLWPNGAIYNSVIRSPVGNARVTLRNTATGAALPAQCFDDPVQQNQVTVGNGFYKFDLNFSDASCPADGTYFIEVTPPAGGYMDMPSQIIALPQDNNAASPFPVPDCPGNALYDAVTGTSDYCEAMPSATVPAVSVLPDDIQYYLYLRLSNGTMPGQSQIFNNFIPLDPELDGAVAITKVSAVTDVTRGALVPYTITVSNVYGAPLYNISIVDRFPAGFKYVAGSARLDGNPTEPYIDGQELTWDNLELQFDQKYTLRLLLVVSSGVSEGEYVNRALVRDAATDTMISEVATATVRVTPDPDFDCTDVIGKVYDDGNLNGRQDGKEAGLPGVRVVTARGLIATTDKYGRFHITCATVPDEDRGSNFILKLDERSLPTGYRLTTENPRVQRATRGKMLRFNFGATVHHVVGIDIADGAFEPGSAELRMQWAPRIDQLVDELKKGQCVLRLSYLGDVEPAGLVNERLDALKREISRQWQKSGGDYRLTIETEIFWRRGAPLSR